MQSTLDNVLRSREEVDIDKIVVEAITVHENALLSPAVRTHFTAGERSAFVELTKPQTQTEVIRTWNITEKSSGGIRVLTSSTLSSWVVKAEKNSTSLDEHRRGPRQLVSVDDGKKILSAFDRFRSRCVKVQHKDPVMVFLL